jgi:hypothetical protein
MIGTTPTGWLIKYVIYSLITSRTSVVDIGASSVDANRRVWDRLASLTTSLTGKSTTN